MSIQLKIVSICTAIHLAASGMALAAQVPSVPASSPVRAISKWAAPPVPIWTGTIRSPADGKSYQIRMVGTDPYATIKTHTVIQYAPIALRITFPDGTIFDPQDRLACTSSGGPDSISASQRVFNSPLFVPTKIKSNGVDVSAGLKQSGTQLLDAYVRANFWSSAKNSNYGVSFKAISPPIVVNVNAPKGSFVQTGDITCGGSTQTIKVGVMPPDSMGKIIRDYQSKHSSLAQLTVVLTHNVGEALDSSILVEGHSTGATDSYIWADVLDNGADDTGRDISYMASEFAYWITNPFGTNTVPGISFTPCAPPGGNYYELDVLNPIESPDRTLQAGSDSFTYHFSDIAFFDYLYRFDHLQGTGFYALPHRKYSFMGTLSHNAGKVCP